MSHHSEDMPIAEKLSKLTDQKKELLQKQLLREKIGPTGQFPDGKLVDHDEGELVFAINHLKGKVVIDFGKPVHSVGMTPHQAVALANTLIRKARDANIIGASKEPLTVEL